MLNSVRNTLLSATMASAAFLPLMGSADTIPQAALAAQMAKPTAEMQAVLDALKSLGARPIHTQTKQAMDLATKDLRAAFGN